jgi:hypothetical protein
MQADMSVLSELEEDPCSHVLPPEEFSSRALPKPLTPPPAQSAPPDDRSKAPGPSLKLSQRALLLPLGGDQDVEHALVLLPESLVRRGPLACMERLTAALGARAGKVADQAVRVTGAGVEGDAVAVVVESAVARQQ